MLIHSILFYWVILMDNSQLIDKLKTIVYYCLGFVLFLLVIGVICINYVVIDGKKYDKSVETLIITDSDFARYNDYSFLKAFSRLKTVDVSSLDVSKDTVDHMMSDAGENVNILWNVKIGGNSYKSNTEHLTVPAETLGEDSEAFSAFHHLKQFEIEGTAPIEELYKVIGVIRRNNPEVRCVYSSKIYGIPIDGTMDRICLDNKKIKNLDLVKYAVELFPNIKKFEMCDCGVSDEEMGNLRAQYPDREFKWMLHILIYDIPTDVQVFSTLVSNWVAYADHNTFAPIFKYCTDLRALDLGHWDNISDISEIRNLKNLEILIISDNSISDLTPLTELKHLKYMDLRYNKITDVSPLTELHELQFLEVGGNKLSNAAQLCGCRSLKFLYIEDSVLPEKTIKELEKGVPEGCEFSMHHTRGHEWYKRIIGMFRRWKKVKVYHDWENVEYYED